MKRFLSLTLSVLLVLSLSACGSSGNTADSGSAGSARDTKVLYHTYNSSPLCDAGPQHRVFQRHHGPAERV